jgi:hypothetical protein
MWVTRFKLGIRLGICLAEKDSHLVEKDNLPSVARSEHFQDAQVQACAFLEALFDLDVGADLGLNL